MVRDTTKSGTELKESISDQVRSHESQTAVTTRALRRRLWSRILADALRGSRTYVENYTSGRGGE